MSEISKLAVIHPSARIGEEVKIGPFCVIDEDTEIGDGCILHNNVTIGSHTRIGKKNVFYQNVVIGVAPQDLKYRGAPTRTVVGDHNVFRECVTVHRGTENGGGETVIGNNGLYMVACHIAHDCHLGNRIILGNQSQLAGHVSIEDGVVISGLIGIHHFVTVGRYSYIAGMTPVRRDVPPYVKFAGDPNEVRGINDEGLKRNDLTSEDIESLWLAFRQLYRGESRNISQIVDEMLDTGVLNPHVRYMCEFLQRSLQNRYGRFKELVRTDGNVPKAGRQAFEVRDDFDDLSQ